MITLAMDTSYQYLVVGLYEDGKQLAGFAMETPKRQSENLFPALESVLQQAGKTLQDTDSIVITEGPGSYTGLRIAMTVAKVLAASRPMDLYTINTMQLYAGMDPSANVILDARGHRVYAAHVENGQTVWMGILDLDEVPAFLESHSGTLYGDGHLIGKPAQKPDFIENFLALQPVWKKTESIHTLTPLYLKESDSYKV